jgi:biopolymer transport protein ExbD
MRMHHHQRRPATTLAFNATPLVDVFFMLTIFYMLVTRFSSAEQIPMELPQPDASQAELTRVRERVIINCRLDDPRHPDASVVLYSLGPNLPEPLYVISDRLGAMKTQIPELKVIVRADRRIPYAEVRSVMRVVARQGIEMLNVVAHVAEDR